MIGLDISDRSLKVVRLSNDSTRRLLGHGTLSLPEGSIENGLVIKPEQVAQGIKKVLEQIHAPFDNSDPVVVSIPEAQSFLRVIEIPVMSDDEIGEAIKWEVAQHIPFGIENVYIDWQLPSGGHKALVGKQEVQVGAAQKKVVNMLYKTLDSLPLDVAAFELESQAVVRALISNELRNKQGLLIVDLGTSGTNVIIYDHGATRFTASLQKGVQYVQRHLPANVTGNIEDLIAGKTIDEQVVTQSLIPALEELVMEIRSIIEFYNSIDEQHEVLEILLTGGGSNLPALDKVFIRFFDNVHVQRGNPWVNLLSNQRTAQPPMNIQESVRYTTALGLALREVKL